MPGSVFNQIRHIVIQAVAVSKAGQGIMVRNVVKLFVLVFNFQPLLVNRLLVQETLAERIIPVQADKAGNQGETDGVDIFAVMAPC